MPSSTGHVYIPISRTLKKLVPLAYLGKSLWWGGLLKLFLYRYLYIYATRLTMLRLQWYLEVQKCQHRWSMMIYGRAGGVGQDHVHCHLVWRNAKLFCCFSPWKKAALRFQCILKSNLRAKTVTELGISHYTLLRACTEQLCKWPCRLTENISECRLVDRTQVFSIR